MCGVCMLLITAAEREEVSEVQEVVAQRSAVATAPLCLAAESDLTAEPGSGVRG